MLCYFSLIVFLLPLLVKADLDIIHHTTHLLASTLLSNLDLLKTFYEFVFTSSVSSPIPSRSGRNRVPLRHTEPQIVSTKDIIFCALLTCPVDGIRTYFANCFEKFCGIPAGSVEGTHPITFFAELLVSKFPWPSTVEEEYSEVFYSTQYFAFLGKLIAIDKDKVRLPRTNCEKLFQNIPV